MEKTVQLQVLQAGFVDKAAQLQSLQQQVSAQSTPDPEVIALQRQLQQMQVASEALALQMQQLQQQVAESLSAAASLQRDKQAAADQAHQAGLSQAARLEAEAASQAAATSALHQMCLQLHGTLAAETAAKNAALHQVSELERELQQVRQQYSALQGQCSDYLTRLEQAQDQVAELKGASAGVEQQSQAAAQRAKHEQQHLHEQNACLTAELAAVTEDRYELQVALKAVQRRLCRQLVRTQVWA
ncbi:hypothetical protein WJX79_004112 [Trebouxia sp. C0005]